MSNSSLYDRDLYAWTNEQAELLRAGRLAEADIGNIAEEIASMGRAEKRELTSRLTVLLLHLIKWQFQPKRRGSSWEATIKIQRRDLTRLLTDNPSPNSVLPESMSDAYGNALIAAAAETGLSESTFPAACPWPFEVMMAENFWPGAA